MLLKLSAFDGFRRHHDGWRSTLLSQTEEIALVIKTFSAHHGEGLPLTHIAALRTVASQDAKVKPANWIDLRQSPGNGAHSAFNGNSISYSGQVNMPPQVV